jgi:hypothetical protein
MIFNVLAEGHVNKAAVSAHQAPLLALLLEVLANVIISNALKMQRDRSVLVL